MNKGFVIVVLLSVSAFLSFEFLSWSFRLPGDYIGAGAITCVALVYTCIFMALNDVYKNDEQKLREQALRILADEEEKERIKRRELYLRSVERQKAVRERKIQKLMEKLRK